MVWGYFTRIQSFFSHPQKFLTSSIQQQSLKMEDQMGEEEEERTGRALVTWSEAEERNPAGEEPVASRYKRRRGCQPAGDSVLVWRERALFIPLPLPHAANHDSSF